MVTGLFIATALAAILSQEEEAGRHSVMTRTRIGPYLIVRELWSPYCLENGIGPWSEEAWEEEIPEDLMERFRAYQHESELRLENLPDDDLDGPPPGAIERVYVEWALIDPQDHIYLKTFEAVSVHVWRME